MPKMNPANETQAHALEMAVTYLKHARDLLVFAKCPRTLSRLRAALKSAEGAQRHMRRRTMDKHLMAPKKSAEQQRAA